MIENLPAFVSITFGLTTIATILLFYLAIKNADTQTTRQRAIPVLAGLIIWLLIQAVLSLKNVYNTGTASLPPKLFLLGILPTIIVIICLFATQKGRQFTDSLPLKNLAYIHVVRIPVEIVLLWLFLYKAIPQLMTFEGRNFDILAGITAPFIAWYGLTKAALSQKLVLIWNFVCLGLLINIVANALLSSPFAFQQFAFEQPDIAILYFPFSWLPACIVPIVLFSHLVSIRQLLLKKETPGSTK